MTAPDWPHPLVDDDVIFIDLSLNKTLRSDRAMVQDTHWLWRGRPAVWARYVVQQWNTFTFLSRTLSMVILTPHIFHRLGFQFTALRPGSCGWSWSVVWAHITHHNQYWVISNRPLPNPSDIKTSKLKPAHIAHSCPPDTQTSVFTFPWFLSAVMSPHPSRLCDKFNSNFMIFSPSAPCQL